MKKLFLGIWKRIESLVLWCSGASVPVLNEVPIEKSKYFGIGGTVLFTAMMATLTGGYAFYTAFLNVTLAIIFGIFWGALIFNLDRYIVSSFGSGDGKRTISGQELIEASPRIVMAIILGIVISTPLEMKLFEKEITTKMREINAQKNTTSGTFITGDTLLNSLQSQKNSIKTNNTDRDNEVQKKYAAWQNAAKDANDELYRGKFSGHRGKGPTYDRLNSQAIAAENTYRQSFSNDQQSDKSDSLLSANIDSSIAKRTRELQAGIVGPLGEAIAQNDGFLARFQAFSALSDDPENTNWIHPITVVKLMIALLFILIEIAPILFKMMTERGPYDDKVDGIKYEVKVRQLELQSNLNQEINTALKIHTHKFDQKLAEEAKTNEEVFKAVARAQQEIAIAAINKWKEEQKEKMNQSNLHSIVNGVNV